MRIAFHSYKGGVGRTKMMVGTGALLALEGFRVAMLDFDLDASGLATIFRADPKRVGEKELLHILQRADLSLAHDALLDVTDFIAARFETKPKTNGWLKYIPTISDPKISDNINFNPSTRYVISALLESLIQDCGVDLLLIDLKPGYSPSSSAILPLVDRAVIVTRVDAQNIVGLSKVLPIHAERGLKCFLIANLVPESPRAAQRIAEMAEATRHKVDIRIPYDPEAALDDDIESLARSESPVQLGLKTLVSLILKKHFPRR